MFRLLCWQDVPSVVQLGGEKRQLPDWFQQEIDRRAMDQGLLGSDAYLEQWQWREEEFEGGLDAFEAELITRYQVPG